MTWAEGQLLQSGKYQIIRQLGGGGFGLTYLAEDPSLRRQVVIKTPNRIFQRDQEYERFVRRFKREGQALARISHPNVVRVVEYFEEQGMPCLVMAYVQGETLNQVIRRRGQLPEGEAVQCFRQLATALQFVHQEGLIHCDVHPGNIMLRQAGDPVLIDFGSAKTLHPSTQTVTTTTNDFAPYEQGQPDGKPQPTLDIYGLAATLYFAVTGSKPQSAMSRKLYGDTLKTPKQHRAALSTWLNQAILKGMALEAQDRPTSMHVWLNLLQPPQVPKFRPAAQSETSKPEQPTQTVQLSFLLQPPQVPKFRPAAQSGKSKPKQPTQTVQPSFPWIRLGIFALGYLPVGILLGWSSSSVLAWAWTWVSVATAAGVLAATGDWVVAVAVAVAVAGVVVGDWAVAVAGTVVGTVVGAVVGAKVGTVIGAEAEAILGLVGLLMGASFGGSISGYFTSLGFWSVLGLGLIALMQLFLICVCLDFSSNFLDNCDHKSKTFIIGATYSLGLALGGGLGWWLKLSGFKFPF
jgi:serine/threonine protein kinase